MSNDDRDKIGILIFDDVEVLDFCGPLEVFHTSGAVDVVTVGPEDGPIRAVTGLQVSPDHSVQQCPPLDVLVVPGGRGTTQLQDDDGVIRWLQDRYQEVDLLTTVCTGSVLVAAADLLRGLHATTHWGAIRRLEKFDGVTADWDSRIVDAGKIITSAGISAGIDMALYVLETRYGQPALRRAVNAMEYDSYPQLKPNYKRPTFVKVAGEQR